MCNLVLSFRPHFPLICPNIGPKEESWPVEEPQVQHNINSENLTPEQIQQVKGGGGRDPYLSQDNCHL